MTTDDTTTHSPAPFRLVSGSTGHVILDSLGDSIGALAARTGDHSAEEQLANARLFAAAPDLLARLEASTAALIAERDSYYDGATTPSGEYTAPDDARIVAEMDAEIDANRAALAKVRGEA